MWTAALTQDIERVLAPKHQVSCVALLPGLSLLAVHVPDNRMKSCVPLVLDAVFGGASAELLAVPPGGLGATLRASFPHFSLEVMESTPNAPEVARRADPPAPQTDREKQRLEEWHAALAELGSSLRPVDDGYTVTDGRCTWVHFERPGLPESCANLIVH